MYSSIEEDDRNEVIEKCYWPVFSLAENGIPIGIEASAVTLEIISDLDSEWVATLKKYINERKIEFVGSGYSQIIGPLVPAKVNDWNQKLGLEIYKSLLNAHPRIALINEMTYSAGVVEHYLNHNFEAIIMEWNNPRKYHQEWKNELRYFPQKALGNNGYSIPVIWADTIAFQKFQHYAHGEYSIIDYIDYLQKHNSKDVRYFPLYLNDIEIFDYRPGRYHNEPKLRENSEWEQIINLYNELSNQEWIEFLFPSQVIDIPPANNCFQEIKLESPEQPIPVKKQEKYNINRWALTGRDDLGINSKCYQIYERLISEKSENPIEWKELCFLWSSDFRTHITEKRWNDYKKQLEFANQNVIPENNNKASVEVSHSIPLDEPGVKCYENEGKIIAENIRIRLVLDKDKGMTTSRCTLKYLSEKHLFGTLDHGYFEDISFGENYYSGHTVIERLGQHKIIDIDNVIPKVTIDESKVVLVAEQQAETYWGNVKAQQNILFKSEISLEPESIRFNKEIIFNDDIWWRSFLGMAVVRPFSITFNPKAWDINTIYYKTHNGGSNYEIFRLAGSHFDHSDIYSSLISAKHALGATKGLLAIGDKDKEIVLKCNMTMSALIPSVVFLPQQDDMFLLRVQYSAREVDETVSKMNSINAIIADVSINC